jgi:hypothetical protein
MASLAVGDDGLAIPLDVAEEALVEAPASQVEEVQKNRQARRKAKRKKAKAAKRAAMLESVAPVLEAAQAEQFFEGEVPFELVAKDNAVAEAEASADPKSSSTSELSEKPAIALEDSTSESMEQHLITDQPKVEDESNAGSQIEREAEPAPEPKLLNAPARQPDAPLVDTEALSELLSSCPTGMDPALDEVFNPVERERPPALAAEIANRPIDPIPRHNALADPNAKVLTRLRLWIMRFFEPRVPARTEASANQSIDQLVELRSDLATIQKRVDRMIAANRS